MGKKLKRSIWDSLLHVVGRVLGTIYDLLFSGLEERSYQSNRRQFVANINDSFSQIFSERNGSVHPDEGVKFPRAFDFVSVTLEFEKLRFRLVAGRGELALYITPSNDPDDWQDLGTVVWGEGRDRNRFLERASSVDRTAQYIRNNWNELVSMYSSTNTSIVGLKRTRLSKSLSE